MTLTPSVQPEVGFKFSSVGDQIFGPNLKTVHFYFYQSVFGCNGTTEDPANEIAPNIRFLTSQELMSIEDYIL